MRWERGHIRNKVIFEEARELENIKRMLLAAIASIFSFSGVGIYDILRGYVQLDIGIFGALLGGTALLNALFALISYKLLKSKRIESYKVIFMCFVIFQDLVLCLPMLILNSQSAIMLQFIFFVVSLSLISIISTKEQIVCIVGEIAVLVALLVTKSVNVEHSLYALVIASLGNIIVHKNYVSFLQRVEGESKISSAKSQAETDPMTSLLNRRGLSRRIAHIWPMCIRQKLEVAVVMLDIDFFKRYNDAFGHAAGDECIRKVAEVIKSCTKRKTDCAARVGGEEFLVVLTEITKADAINWAMECKKAIEDLRIQHANNNFLPYVTVSIGIGHGVPENAKNEFWELRNEADRGLYQAKEAGRACLFVDNQMYAKTMVESNVKQYMKERSFRSL